MLAALGFATIAVLLLLTMTKRASVLVALILLPVLAALIGGFAGDLGELILGGLSKVAPTGIMIAFAVLYFSLMVDAGLFDPLIRGLLRVARGDPLRITVATAVLTLCVALDGDGASTFLITVSALLPVYQRLGMNPLVLSGVVCLGAGVMNMVPWGGPTVRAMAALKLDSSEVFTPVLPTMGLGVAWVLVASYLLGRRERNRLAALSPHGPAPDACEGEDKGDDRGPAASAPVTATTEPESSRHATAATADGERQARGAPGDGPGTVRVPPLPRTWLNTFNLLLTLALVICLIQEVLPLPVLFVLGFAIALLVNHPTWEQQQALLDKHAKSVVLVTTMIFAAGVLTGILSGTRMIDEMAETLVSVVPDSFGSHLPVAVAVTGMPLSLVFTPDAYYFGVLPVLAETAQGFGTDPAEVARAAILGQMTTGFPLSPLTASTFILVGMSGVSLGEHQRFIFRWAFATTLVMTVGALLTGVFPL
ncbi:citrate:proton symporter [Streptomyces europaeiscabiei]|uniref:Citrate:proton symporter n=1 Tax=Streptomyces europaeiscabiei TaxID=146819 RepID=A0ABU4NRJ7_9ACTN|nr:citrate:proton symporter [Streptomyces europaeiscabiei]MDX3547603.1 citrate:proton symporter [Streptomyces europaeiscabiei]MDX3557080.1 citrate:proton symporter [Streptomyces europaeiscabiei]MDX3704787.1 citrate:proton symporter [Streptomyces europaeiscabiei]